MLERCPVFNFPSVNIPCEVPGLKLGLFNIEEFCSRASLFTNLANGEREVLVGNTLLMSAKCHNQGWHLGCFDKHSFSCWVIRTIGRLGSIDRRMNLETDIEVLSGKEVLRIWRQNASQSRASTKTLEGLRGDGGSKAGSNRRRGQFEGHHDWLVAV